MRIQAHYIEKVYPRDMYKAYDNFLKVNDNKIVRIISVNNWYDKMHNVNCCIVTYTERDY